MNESYPELMIQIMVSVSFTMLNDEYKTK